MSEEKKPTREYKFVSIKPSALVNVEIGASFYIQLQNLLGFIYQKAPSEDEALRSIFEMTKRLPSTEWEESMNTIMAICYSIEKCAKDQGLTTEYTVDHNTLPKKD